MIGKRLEWMRSQVEGEEKPEAVDERISSIISLPLYDTNKRKTGKIKKGWISVWKKKIQEEEEKKGIINVYIDKNAPSVCRFFGGGKGGEMKDRVVMHLPTHILYTWIKRIPLNAFIPWQ